MAIQKTLMLTLAGTMAGLTVVEAAAPNQPSPELLAARSAYERLGYGMFIHFNMSTYVCSEQQGEKIFKLEHESGKELPASFKPPSGTIDVASWAQVAKDAGMRYGVLTVKHHGGFCLWDSAHTAHDVASSPYGKDVVRQFVDAFRAQGLRVALYYSPQDRNRPNDTAYTKAQITELLTAYGPIDALWLDQYGWPKEIDRQEIRTHIHSLQPTCLFNSNGGAVRELGDVVNAEMVGRKRADPPPFDPARVHVPNAGKSQATGGEVCDTMRADGGWFWKSHGNDDLRPDDHHLNSLQRQLQSTGSYLLDVTPDQDGRIPKEQIAQLMRIAPKAKALLAANPPGIVRGGQLDSGDRQPPRSPTEEKTK